MAQGSSITRIQIYMYTCMPTHRSLPRYTLRAPTNLSVNIKGPRGFLGCGPAPEARFHSLCHRHRLYAGQPGERAFTSPTLSNSSCCNSKPSVPLITSWRAQQRNQVEKGDCTAWNYGSRLGSTGVKILTRDFVGTWKHAFLLEHRCTNSFASFTSVL